MLVTELPYGLKGKVYRSPMPFSNHDPDCKILTGYLERWITVVVVLEELEYLPSVDGEDLLELYSQMGFEYVHMPLSMKATPSGEWLDKVSDIIIKRARAGKNVAVHCMVGVDRTGVVAAVVAKKVLGMTGEEAVLWTRQQVPHALSKREHVELVIDF